MVDLKGRSFDIPVAIACYAGNLDIYAQCKKDEIYNKWTRAQSHAIEPVEVKSEPCQERVIHGAELKERGLDKQWVGRMPARGFKSKTSIQNAWGPDVKPIVVSNKAYIEDARKWLDTAVKPVWEN